MSTKFLKEFIRNNKGEVTSRGFYSPRDHLGYGEFQDYHSAGKLKSWGCYYESMGHGEILRFDTKGNLIAHELLDRSKVICYVKSVRPLYDVDCVDYSELLEIASERNLPILSTRGNGGAWRTHWLLAHDLPIFEDSSILIPKLNYGELNDNPQQLELFDGAC